MALSGKKVLIADDEPDVQVFVQAALEADGHQILTASNGEAALEKAGVGRRESESVRVGESEGRRGKTRWPVPRFPLARSDPQTLRLLDPRRACGLWLAACALRPRRRTWGNTTAASPKPSSTSPLTLTRCATRSRGYFT